MARQRIAELYGRSTGDYGVDWRETIDLALCPYLGRRCLKTRKSEPGITIGTCSVEHTRIESPVMICPSRLLQKRRIFADSMHLIASHEPGNDLHLVPEFSIPGGSVDYVLASVRSDRVVDFVGIELQTLDTSGTVWPERQRFLVSAGADEVAASASSKRFGMNWKMTSKTTLLQLHHKLGTFEHVNRRLVLVLQDHLLSYMRREFRFDHLVSPASAGDSLQIHAYRLVTKGRGHELRLGERASTDAEGIAAALDLQAESMIGLEPILAGIESRLSADTLLELA